MEWITISLAIILPVCVLGGLFWLLARRQSQSAGLALRHNRNTVWAAARVISFEQEDGTGENLGKVRVKLILRISGYGARAYSASAAWLVDPVYLPQIQPGAEVSVRINRNHPEMIYPNMPGMEHFPHR